MTFEDLRWTIELKPSPTLPQQTRYPRHAAACSAHRLRVR
jgi:hypothetical protein